MSAEDVAGGPLVSVVVPSYNHARHIHEALESVAAQSYSNLELVVIDDASTDDSAKVIRELLDGNAFGQRFAGRLRFETSAANGGAHAAINRGLELATGDFISILNSDDRYAAKRIETLAGVLAHGAQLAFSAVAYIDERSRPLDGAHPDVFRLRGHQASIERFASTGFACVCSNVALTSGNLMFARGLLNTIGAFEDLRYCHDWDFLLRAVAHTEPVYVKERLYFYRLHGENAFRELEEVAEHETRRVLSGYFRRLRENDPPNPVAPSATNWPGVFDYEMTRQGFWRYW